MKIKANSLLGILRIETNPCTVHFLMSCMGTVHPNNQSFHQIKGRVTLVASWVSFSKRKYISPVLLSGEDIYFCRAKQQQERYFVKLLLFTMLLHLFCFSVTMCLHFPKVFQCKIDDMCSCAQVGLHVKWKALYIVYPTSWGALLCTGSNRSQSVSITSLILKDFVKLKYLLEIVYALQNNI